MEEQAQVRTQALKAKGWALEERLVAEIEKFPDGSPLRIEVSPDVIPSIQRAAMIARREGMSDLERAFGAAPELCELLEPSNRPSHYRGIPIFEVDAGQAGFIRVTGDDRMRAIEPGEVCEVRGEHPADPWVAAIAKGGDPRSCYYKFTALSGGELFVDRARVAEQVRRADSSAVLPGIVAALGDLHKDVDRLREEVARVGDPRRYGERHGPNL